MDNTSDQPNSTIKKGSSPIVKFRMSATTPEKQQPSYIKSPVSSSRKHSTVFTTSFVQTPSGPVLTPAEGDRSSLNNRSTTMILLSPSRTIADSLTALASSTAQQLEQVWDDVGYNPEERASQLSDLLRQFRNLCDGKISEERGVAETFRAEIKSAQEELEKTGKALKRMVDPHLLRETMTGYSLTDQLAAVEAALEGLRTAAEAARQDLIQSRQYLMESYNALGWVLEEEWIDIESDWTMERREAFHVKMDEVKQQVATRTNAVISLVQDCQHLLHDLRMDTEQSPLDHRIANSLVRSKDGSFMLTSKFETDTCVGIGSNVLEDLSHRATELTAERKLRKARLQEMGTEIATLWEKLRVSDKEQLAFTQSVQGLGEDTMLKGEEELGRLRVLKSKMLGKLIMEARERIGVLWEETNTPVQQQQLFTAHNVTSELLWNDELLDKHDDYITVLEGRLEQMKPILRILERREEILLERMEYEELQHNSERLQQRGAALTKQLMREEKMAKRIKRDLPKLTAILLEKLQEWKVEHGEDFQYGGGVYLETMERQENEWKLYKENESKTKIMKKQEARAQVENRFGGQKNGFKAKKVAGIKSKPLTTINR
jgi:Ase1/PRC1/MAP65 family protein